MKIINKIIVKFINEYIQKYHSDKFIHIDKIQDEIELRIKNSEIRLNKIRDKQEEDKLRALELDFKIKEAGQNAELTRLEKIIDDVNRLRDFNEKLYYRNLSRAKELGIITSINENIGKEIIKDVGENLGKLEKISLDTNAVLKEIKDNVKEDSQALQIEESKGI
jgi:hypothetical protein